MTAFNYEKLTTRMAVLMPVGYIYIYTFSRRFYPKRLTYVRLTMYTHFIFTLMAHCTSGAIRGSVSCSMTLRQGIKLANFGLLNDFSTPVPLSPHCRLITHPLSPPLSLAFILSLYFCLAPTCYQDRKSTL